MQMQSFSFQTTRSILSEVGSTAKIGQLLADRGCKKVAFVTGANILELGLADMALAGIKDAGIDVWVFSDVVADPPQELILDAVEQAKQQNIDSVVSVGGGSSLDTAKLIAVLVNSEQTIEEMYGVGMVKGERLPLILAPTTAGTGSEVTPISIVTTGATEKKGVVSPQLLPDYAVLDAELTVGLPASVTAATGIDAMVHAIEAYTSKIKKNVVADCLARQALELLGANIRQVCSNPEYREARANMLLGSMLAGMAFANAPVAAVHALAYPLGGHFHVPHGLSNALILCHVMRFNSRECKNEYAVLAPYIFPEIDISKPSDLVATEVICKLQSLIKDLGLETKLTEVGITDHDVDRLAEDALKQTRLLINNPREVSLEDAKEIYKRAL